jgi:uncharacterized membrane-anchored protein
VKVISWRLLCASIVAMVPALSIAQQQSPNPVERIAWEVCPCTARLGDEALVSVPAGFRFAGAEGTRQFLTLTENPTDGTERGMVLRDGDDGWFAVFEYNETGYVSDAEKDDLDADAILASLQKGNARGNELRRERGWSEVEMRGWHEPPHFDSVSSNLTWSTRVGAPGRDATWVNHSVRLLGRRGTMKVDLVADAADMDAALPHFDQVVRGFAYLPGQRYAEFTKGDKIAEYGLTALIAGGGGAVAAKSGLLGKLGKFLVYIVIAVLASIKALWSRLFGGRDEVVQTPPMPPTAG